jgi:hypothetical protein
LDPRLKRRHKCGHLFLGLNAEIAGPAVIDLELSGDHGPLQQDVPAAPKPHEEIDAGVRMRIDDLVIFYFETLARGEILQDARSPDLGFKVELQVIAHECWS